MPEDTSTSGASADDQGAGTGASGTGAGSSSGTQADAVKIAAEKEALEAQRRQLQSERDQLRAEIDRLKSERKPEPVTATTTDPLTEDRIVGLLRREREISAAIPTLQTEFPHADPSIFSASYDSVEALRAAAENSHSSFKSRLDALGVVPKTEAEKQLAAYRERYGELEATTPPDNGGQGGPTGLPTVQQIAAMSFAERDALEAKHGAGTVRQILRSATSQG